MSVHLPKAALAVVAASLVLALGVGGGSYAARLITGADIKNGTVTSADVQNGSLRARDLAPIAVAGLAPAVYTTFEIPDTTLTDQLQAVIELRVPRGNYAVTATGNVFNSTEDDDALGQCWIRAPRHAATNNPIAATTIPPGGLYAVVSTQAVVAAVSPTTIRFRCIGSNAGINQVSLTATKVGTLHVAP
jgi:hypothetical protein